MYSVYADDICIYHDISPLESVKLINPKLDMEDSAAGQFECTIPPINAGYDTVERLTTEIIIKRDDVEIWSGRVISESEDFYKRRKIVCEGELAILNDTTQPPAEYHTTITGFLTSLLSIHNSKVSAKKQFQVGIVTVTDPNDYIYRYTNYESTMECINEKLVERLGGHLRIRKINGVRYLDYLADYPETSPQIINFGRNLMDFTKNYDASKIVTVAVPLGEALEESPIEALEAYLTVESVNQGSIYVQSNAVSTLGWIETIIDYPDVTDASNLLKKAQDYLSAGQFEDMSITIQVVDLHNLNPDIKALELLDTVRCISEPHGLDKIFPVTKISIPLDSPANLSMTLGSDTTQNLTSSFNKTQSDILQKIESLPTKQSVLTEAKNNATQLINDATTGFVTIIKDGNGAQEILITDTQDYLTATKVWRWNVNGLGYSKNGYRGPYELAMTMDGKIMANFITAGTMAADRINGGTLTLGGNGNNNGILRMLDVSGNAIGTWDNNGVNAVGTFKTFHKEGIYCEMKGNAFEMANSDGTIRGRISYIDNSSGPLFGFSGNYKEKGGVYIGTWDPDEQKTLARFIINEGGNPYGYTERFLFVTRDSDIRATGRIYLGSGSAYLQGATWDGSDAVVCHNGFYAYGSIGCSGQKYRIVETEHYGKRGLNAFETAEAYFSDLGSGKIGEDGTCKIEFEPIFEETIVKEGYMVQLTRTSLEKTEWVEKYNDFFIVHGEPNATFDWMLIAKQKDYSDIRLNKVKPEVAPEPEELEE